jgi:hypothetical protein
MDMPGPIAYYAIIREGRSPAAASGLARRTFTSAGRLDEALRQDLSWERDSAIYEWERGEELGADLVKISPAEAEALIERFRVKWAALG